MAKTKIYLDTTCVRVRVLASQGPMESCQCRLESSRTQQQHEEEEEEEDRQISREQVRPSQPQSAASYALPPALALAVLTHLGFSTF